MLSFFFNAYKMHFVYSAVTVSHMKWLLMKTVQSDNSRFEYLLQQQNITRDLDASGL